MMKKISIVLLVIMLSNFCAECRRSGGGSRSRGSSGSRSYSRSVATVKPPVQSYGSNYGSSNYNTQRKATNVGTTPRYSIKTQPTVRHQPVTQPTARYYPQQVTQKTVYQQNAGYTQRPHYQQPVYTQKPLYPQQSQYPNQHYSSQNHPNYQQPYYKPSYTGSSYNSPGGYYHKKDHSVRNTVLAGLGGSALGMYLGYKLGGYTHSMNNPNYGGGYGGGYGGSYGGSAGSGYPQYSVVHHYHHGDKPIIQNAVVESNVIAECKDVSICTPNTTPLCMTNGTIYCVTPVDKTSICNVNSTTLQCVNATITAPCLNETDGNCNSTNLTTENLEIPCVSSINVYGDFGTNKLSVHTADGSTGQNTLTTQGVNNKYCVTIIAEPFVEPKGLSNAEFANYLQENPQAKYEADIKVEDIINSIGGFMFF